MKQKKSLTDKSLSGFLWSFIGVGGQAILQLIVLAILARLLSPADFGVVSAAVVVSQFSNIFSELGVGPAIIQRSDIKEDDLRVGFTLSLFFGTFIALLIYLCAPIISGFFKIPQLEKVLFIYSFIFIIKGFSAISEALLQRELKFKIITSIELFSFAFGYACVGIYLADQGYGYWSLVGAHLSQSFIKAVGVIVCRFHSMKPLLDKKIIRGLLYFGSGHSIARIANFLANQGDNLVIGRMLGAEALGNYGRAYQLVVMPANMFGQVFDRVLFPVMSKVQDDTRKLSEAYKKSVSIITWVMIPFSCLMWILSQEIIRLILGAKWLSLVLPFQILAIGLVFRVVHKISDALARSKGAVFKRAWRQCVYAVIVLIGALFGYEWGISGVACGVLIAIISNYLLMTQLCRSLTKLSVRYFIKAHMAGLFVGMVLIPMVSCYTNTLRYYSYSDIAIILFSILLMVVLMILLCKMFPNIFLGKDNQDMLQNIGARLPARIRKLF